MSTTAPTKYTELDFNQLVQKLEDEVRKKDSWKGLIESATAKTFLEILAYASLNMVYNTQRSFEETLVDSAQFWSSLTRLGNLIGYKVKRPVGAKANIRIYPGIEDQTILAGTTLNINGYSFYFPSNVFVSSAGSPVDTVVVEGTLSTYNFTPSNSDALQRYSFGDEFVTDENIQVLVNGTAWEQAPYVLLESDGMLYELSTLPTKQLEVMFGTTTTGVPLQGQSISVKAYTVSGPDANYYGQDIEYDDTVDGLEVEVFGPITGGGLIETVENLRQNIPLNYRIKSGIVAKKDYEIFIENLPGVTKAKALDVTDVKQVPFRVVRVYIVPDGGYESNDGFLTSIENKLDMILPAGVKLELWNPLVREVVVGVNLTIQRGFNNSNVIAEVTQAIQDLYNVNNISFGQWITTTEIRNTATAVRGVSSAIILKPTSNITTMKDFEICKLIQLEVV